MGNILEKKEADQLIKDVHKITRDRSDAKAVWRGIRTLIKSVEEIVLGTSAIGTLVMAEMFVLSKRGHYPHIAIYGMSLAVVMMGLVALSALGKYLKEKGRQ